MLTLACFSLSLDGIFGLVEASHLHEPIIKPTQVSEAIKTSPASFLSLFSVVFAVLPHPLNPTLLLHSNGSSTAHLASVRQFLIVNYNPVKHSSLFQSHQASHLKTTNCQ